MPVLETQAFVFSTNGRSGPRARSLQEFMGLLAVLPSAQIEAHLKRHDFSRWLEGVFRDNPLGSHVHVLEGHVDTDDVRDVAADIAQAIVLGMKPRRAGVTEHAVFSSDRIWCFDGQHSPPHDRGVAPLTSIERVLSSAGKSRSACRTRHR